MFLNGRAVLSIRWTHSLILLFAAAALCTSIPIARAQNKESRPIRVVSPLIVVPTSVFDKRALHQKLNQDGVQCLIANQGAFYKLDSSEPYRPLECPTAAIRHLELKDFRLFLAGAERQIASVTLVPEPEMTIRDSLGKHNEWSNTPRGKWSTADLGSNIGPEAGGALYLISYVPSNPSEGKCDHVKVEVGRPNAAVFARDEYCYTDDSQSDLLKGTSLGKLLENHLNWARPGNLDLSLQAAWFYTGARTFRVEISLEFQSGVLKHKWENNSLHATVGILGTVRGNDGELVARFSDLACCTRDHPYFILNHTSLGGVVRQDAEQAALPGRYETQIDLPPGQYTLHVVLSDGTNFGRAQMALPIEDYDESGLALSPILLCKRLRDASAATLEAAIVNLAPRYVPLVSDNIQVTPSNDTTFYHGEPLIAYFVVYAPVQIDQSPPTVNVNVKVVDAKTGEQKELAKSLNANPYERPGTWGIPMAVNLAADKLSPGAYRLEVQATDSLGSSTTWSTADFTVEGLYRRTNSGSVD